ncbi:hypothetical protein N7468_002538 [Penicillium chermesinum]|uniref:Reverse transcriptase n=1 Tax=Penicillium chermesinum TaxID=63820 RepID=A0A9W9TXR0_9EURO|nr:uncharacterized protein N7468_002538 [Penicillium chermesinum]KAJ5247555.1 hypothetical protein N7468_002538 [Penicillium chermesinum]KAJ6145790.1 hypothetical protein N7470_009685 [Penicillium chermesinum]
MSSTGALPQTLKSITTTKIRELSKQRVLFDRKKKQIVADATAAQDLRAKARILLDGLSSLKGYPKDPLDQDDMDLDLPSYYRNEDGTGLNTHGMGQLFQADHTNIRRFLLQARYDASISDNMVREWISKLENELQFLELKHEHASFYTKLVTEWLSNLDESTSSPEIAGASFEKVGRVEMHEQRAIWEELVFTPGDHVDKDSIRAYLDNLFTKSKLSRQALELLRGDMHKLGSELATQGEWLDEKSLEWVSDALMNSDMLSDEKTNILKEFMRNKEVHQEVADVLNMRLASLESWNWGNDGIPVEMRRQLNGKYRVFMDADLLDSLMLQYLGTTWAVKFRSTASKFFRSLAWTPVQEDIPEEYREKRKYFTQDTEPDQIQGINGERTSRYQSDYFMSQLPETVMEGSRNYDDDSKSKNALETKHSLLHLLITESIIQKELRGEFTAIRSDYQWFSPGLSHATILTVLGYFGVPEVWLNFFKVFLEAPLKFVQDGPSASTRVRKRGVPMSHTLSDFFGEAVLFCMDYAVNQDTHGGILYRLHDDFWFWGTEETCNRAWLGMTSFASVMGLQFNMEKTGAVRMGSAALTKNTILPQGDIRWGFLVLDAEKGRFIIDQAQVDQHIEELDRQLSSCRSVFAWVQAWNGYFGRFFTNNFARPAMCFGRDHIDMAISTLSRIEKTLFSKTSDGASQGKGGVTDYLRSIMVERFGVRDVPEGFFYYPVELGGLGLLNPFVRLLAMRENIKQTPQKRLHRAVVADEEDYLHTKQEFKSSRHSTLPYGEKATSSMTLEEFMMYPETFSSNWLEAYLDLRHVPEELSVSPTASFSKHQSGLESRRSTKASPISSRWELMTPYWRWVAELYHEEMVRTYGSLAAVNREFMPLGVIKTLQQDRFRWQG